MWLRGVGGLWGVGLLGCRVIGSWGVDKERRSRNGGRRFDLWKRGGCGGVHYRLRGLKGCRGDGGV